MTTETTRPTNLDTLTAKAIKAARSGYDVEFADGSAAIVSYERRCYSVAWYDAECQPVGTYEYRYTYRTWADTLDALRHWAAMADCKAAAVQPLMDAVVDDFLATIGTPGHRIILDPETDLETPDAETLERELAMATARAEYLAAELADNDVIVALNTERERHEGTRVHLNAALRRIATLEAALEQYRAQAAADERALAKYKAARS